jgi:hypothetical protein
VSKAGEIRLRLSFDGKLLGPRVQAERLAAMLADGTLKRLRVVFVPEIVGGASAPTLIGAGVRSLLEKSVRLRLDAMRCRGRQCEADYLVLSAGVFASAVSAKGVKKPRCKRATRKTNSSVG